MSPLIPEQQIIAILIRYGGPTHLACQRCHVASGSVVVDHYLKSTAPGQSGIDWNAILADQRAGVFTVHTSDRICVLCAAKMSVRVLGAELATSVGLMVYSHNKDGSPVTVCLAIDNVTEEISAFVKMDDIPPQGFVRHMQTNDLIPVEVQVINPRNN